MFIRRGVVPQGSADSAPALQVLPQILHVWADSYVKLRDGKRP